MSSKSAEESDDDVMSFFAVPKRRKPARPITPPRARSSSPEFVHTTSSDAEEDGEGVKKKSRRPATRKKKVKKVPVPVTWVHRPVEKKRGESSTGGLKKVMKEVIETTAPETEEHRMERRKKELMDELPPLEPMKEAQRTYIHKVIRDHMDQAVPIEPSAPSSPPPDVTAHIRASSPPSRPNARSDEKVTINVRMVADPDKRDGDASARAIARYEMRRVMIMNRRDPLSRMLGDLGDRVHKPASELVLEWKGVKIHYPSATPFDMGIAADENVDMLCYEKDIWAKIKGVSSSRRRERSGSDEHQKEQDAPNGAEGMASSMNPATTDPTAERSSSPPLQEQEHIIVKLEGSWGSAKVKVAGGIMVSDLLQAYSRKWKIVQAEDIKLVFDGEVLARDSCVQDAGIETGDMIEVHPV